MQQVGISMYFDISRVPSSTFQYRELRILASFYTQEETQFGNTITRCFHIHIFPFMSPVVVTQFATLQQQGRKHRMRFPKDLTQLCYSCYLIGSLADCTIVQNCSLTKDIDTKMFRTIFFIYLGQKCTNVTSYICQCGPHSSVKLAYGWVT